MIQITAKQANEILVQFKADVVIVPEGEQTKGYDKDMILIHITKAMLHNEIEDMFKPKQPTQSKWEQRLEEMRKQQEKRI